MPRKKKVVDAAVPSTVAPAVQVSIPQDRIQLITAWKEASDKAAEWGDKENVLRQAIVSQLFDGNKLEGTEAVDIGWGYQLKVTKEMNYTASNKDGEAESLVEMLQLRGVTELAEKLIKWKPDVSKPAYRKVFELATQLNDTEILAACHKTITVKPGMPQLHMVPVAAPEAPPTYPIEQTGEVITDGSNVTW